MPNAYAKLGRSGGSILDALGGGPTAASRGGYTAGVDAGVKRDLADSQMGKVNAETQKIMQALQVAKDAQAVTGEDLYRAGGGTFDRQAGPMRAGDVMPEDRAMPMDPTALNQSNLLQKIQQMAGGGGTANTIMQALSGLKKRGNIDEMIAGTQATAPVAQAMAAIAGKDAPSNVPGGGSGGSKGRPAADVQSIAQLMNTKKSDGKPYTLEEAVRIVHGDQDAKMWVNMYEAQMRQYASPEEAAAAAGQGVDAIINRRNPNATRLEPARPVNIRKVYK